MDKLYLALLLTSSCFYQLSSQPYIYFSDTGNDRIVRTDLNGENPETLIKNLPGLTTILVDTIHEKIYWYQGDQAGKLFRADLDGANKESLLETYTSAFTVDFQTSDIYINALGHIYRKREGGNQLEYLSSISSLGPLLKFDAEQRMLYIYGEGSVYQYHPDSDEVEEVPIEGLDYQLYEMTYDKDVIYIGKQTDRKIVRFRIKDQDQKQIHSGSNYYNTLDIDHKNSKLYWAEQNTGIMRANYDGSGREVLFEVERTYLSLDTRNALVRTKGVSGDILFEVYPNPAKHSIKVNVPENEGGKYTLKIYTPDGKTMAERAAIDHNTVINLSSFKSGLYLVEITNGTHKSIQKLVKLD